jgi:hypothetical protein
MSTSPLRSDITEARAQRVTVTADTLVVDLVDGRSISVPVDQTFQTVLIASCLIVGPIVFITGSSHSLPTMVTNPANRHVSPSTSSVIRWLLASDLRSACLLSAPQQVGLLPRNIAG